MYVKRVLVSVMLGGLCLPTGCGPTRKAETVEIAGRPGQPPPPAPGGKQATTPGAAPATPTAGPPPAHPPGEVPPERRAVLVSGDKERIIDTAEAVAAGYTVVDLSDSWTPFIFQTLKNEAGEDRPNRYRRIFVGLANDQLDDDGQPLDKGAKNYLELFGIPPSLSVVRTRFVEDQARTCEADIDFTLLSTAKPVRYLEGNRHRQAEAAVTRERARLEFRRRALGLETLEALAEKEPALAAQVADVTRWDAEVATLHEVEKRLLCEGLLPKTRSRHQPGVYDDALQDAVRRFQQKHMIYESAYLRPRTLSAMGRRFVENNHEALRRVITERVVSAASILEDGSAEGRNGPPSYKGAAGDEQRVRNLVEEFASAALQQLGVTDPAASLAFITRHPPADFQWLKVAVKLPPRPEYYAPHMDLSVVVDRGDVWYDLPFDEKGKELAQPREHYPSFTLFLNYRGQRLPLVRWRTTIGGWRSEQAADGYEYWRYKGSDVGPRVIRNIASGPVWIAPESTPIRTLVKDRRVNGTSQTVVNYDEIGPGFRSAYGLVAGYFVVPGEGGKSDFDNGIRAHGSSEYLSIGAGNFSHGCHRLLNHLAVRLYSFVLTHRDKRVLGDQPLGYERQFLYRDQAYQMRLPSRGFGFELTPPLPVDVLQGRIKGERKVPFTDYLPKAGVVYPGPVPKPGKGGEDKAGDD